MKERKKGDAIEVSLRILSIVELAVRRKGKKMSDEAVLTWSCSVNKGTVYNFAKRTSGVIATILIVVIQYTSLLISTKELHYCV